MNILYKKWWDNGNKVFQIINYKQGWKTNGSPPKFKIRVNKYNEFTDVTIILGFLVFNYVNLNKGDN